MTTVEEDNPPALLGAYLEGYEKDEDPGTLTEAADGKTAVRPPVELPSVSLTPSVQSHGVLSVMLSKETAFKGTKEELMQSNLPASVMYAPLQGPLLPHQRWGGLEQHTSPRISLTGTVQKCHINDAAFDLQRNAFQRQGRAEDPSDFARPSLPPRLNMPLTQDTRQLETKDFAREAVSTAASLAQTPYYKNKSEVLQGGNGLDSQAALSRKQKRQKRIQGGDAGSDTYLGPWAPPAIEEERRAQLQAESQENQKTHAAALAEQAAQAAAGANQTGDAEGDTAASALAKTKVTTIFHGRSTTNFQGLSWMACPPRLQERDDDQINYLPKRLVHTYVGHTMGVQAIRFFPTTGHLLLSASMDSQCKIWDVHNQRKCLRTYMGHSMAVRDIQFADEGKKFYTCSFDKTVCLWDTEYGKIIGTFCNDKTPYCVSVHPQKGMDNVFIIGSSNKRAVQFDAKSGEITQEYNEHLAAVNTVTFCEDGLKIATTADDKKMFIWEFGIPVVVKHIAEPHMHSMPAVRLHPSHKFLACQSMDNQIVVYEACGRYRFQGPKRFKGHSNAGYAISPGFSTDGRFLMSGDVSGKVWFWDWKTTKNQRTLHAHDRVCMGAEWHPTMVSRIATCGWDGLVKLWEYAPRNSMEQPMSGSPKAIDTRPQLSFTIVHHRETDIYGHQLLGPYRLSKTVLGRGSFSKIKLCHAVATGQPYTVKIYRPSILLKKREFISRQGEKPRIRTALTHVYNELVLMQTAIQPHHPHCVALHDVFLFIPLESMPPNNEVEPYTDFELLKNATKLYMVLDHVTLGAIMAPRFLPKDKGMPRYVTLCQELKKVVPPRLDDEFVSSKKETLLAYGEHLVCSFAKDLFSALSYLHSPAVRVAHRDIKPDNLFLTRDGRLKLGDFGAACRIPSSVTGDISLPDSETPSGTAGTYPFLPPEQCDDNEELHASFPPPPGFLEAADVWAAGVTLWALFFGTLPFYSNSLQELFHIIAKGHAELPSPCPISPPAQDFLRSALTRDLHQRPTAQTLLNHIWLRDADPSHTAAYAAMLQHSVPCTLHSTQDEHPKA